MANHGATEDNLKLTQNMKDPLITKDPLYQLFSYDKLAEATELDDV